ncbi:MAG: ABC transporter permease [Pseudolysinimonas sp.]
MTMARHNLSTVIGFEFGRNLSKPRFWIITLVVPIALMVVFALVLLSNTSTDAAANAQKNAHIHFSYLDRSGVIDDAVAAKFGGTPTTDAAAAIAAVKAGTSKAFFEYPANPAKQSLKVYGQDKDIFSNGVYSSVAQALLQASAQGKLDSPQLVQLASGDVNSVTVTYRDGEKTAGFNGVIAPLLYLVAFYLLILLLGNQMLASTLEEKENRVTEMILTTINPTSLILGKIISLFALGLVQMVVFALPLVVAYLLFRSQLNLPSLDLSHLAINPEQMLVGAVILVGGFALFTGTLVAIGAIMPTAKDAGPIFGVLMILIFIPFYIVTLIVSDPTAPIVEFFSWFPYSAPVTALLRNAFGSLPLWQGLALGAELLVLAAIVLRIAVQLFRYGSISYGSRVSLRSALARKSGPSPQLAPEGSSTR